MADKCFDIRLLNYIGTSQSERRLAALDGAYAAIDERTTADLILFAKKYGAYLNYYDATNNINGTWEHLMETDVSFIIADIASWQTIHYQKFLAYINKKITSATTGAQAKKYFKIIFDFIFSLTSHLDRSLNNLPQDLRYASFLSVAISSNLTMALNILFDHYNNFKATLIDQTSTFVDPLSPIKDFVFSQNFDIHKLSSGWQTPATAAISLSGNVKADINHIITHNLFTAPLNTFVNGVINVVGKTGQYLEETLRQYPAHSPHYALYLTFLRLFRFAQNELNQYTSKHLDFYYKEVLRLINRPAQPGFVHLVFELQKNVEAHLLTKGTAVKAGKDDNNHELFYALTGDIVVQKASVQSLKSLYLHKAADVVTLYQSPVADSEDGNGAKLLSADKSWFPFGNYSKAAPANIGFAITSNIFFLTEGNRSITVTFQCASLSGIFSADLAAIFTIQLTGKKNWYTVESYTGAVAGNSFSLSLQIAGDAPSIVPYSKKIHGGSFDTDLPMVHAVVKDYKSYGKIKAVKVLNITIEAGATIKNLSLQNDDGKIDPSKPFKPFGEFPDSGSSLIIGSKEVFQKPLTKLTIHTDWQQAPGAGVKGNAVSLAAGVWSSVPFESSIGLNSSSMNLTGLNNIAVANTDFSSNEGYSITSIDGFIKIKYNSSDSSFASYLNKVKAAIAQTSVTIQKDSGGNVTGFKLDAPAIQGPPTPPVARSVSIDYTAKETILFNENSAAAFAGRKNSFYHIEPFGFRELHPFATDDALNFLPVFNLDDGQPKHDGGELWLALNSALPGQSISMLFQLADGSSNPLKNTTSVKWYYLSANNWLQFNHLLISDQTNNLTRSGLIIINIPAEATSSNDRATPGLVWIKAVVDHDPDAVCKMIAVKTNGAKAIFIQDIDNGVEYSKPLDGNIISKLAVPDAAIKKTEQPYPSFDGRIRETNEAFYVRVSERLRHNHRSIARWDYERLVLQYFPQIHKVKCLNHTGFLEDEKTKTQKYSELLPAHVTLITIPDLSQLTTANKLHPYTSIGLLTEIQQYLEKLASPFVKLHVTNPQFEEVQFDFKVTFYQNLDAAFYAKMLSDEIEQFLTPWAYKTSSDIEFGGKVEKSVVLNFVEERPYVDFVTCFKMNHVISRQGSIINEALYDVEEAIATTARSILVSHCNEETKQKHIINSPASCDCNA